MLRWSGRSGTFVLLFVICIGVTACGSDGSSGSPSTRPASAVTDTIRDQDIDAALAIVEKEFSGCRGLKIDVIGGSTAVRPNAARKMTQDSGPTGLTPEAARSDPSAIVVVLRELDMFLVELGSGGRRRPVPFNDAAASLLRSAHAGGDQCGTVAAARYGYRPPPSS